MEQREVVYLALGSNLGDREGQLEEARQRLAPEVRITAQSPVYETEPWGITDQGDFLNQVIKGETTLLPEELLDYLKDIEGQMGRQKVIRNGPRVIDLDILLYGDRVISRENLQIPHPRMTDRPFVMVPLQDITPDLIIPGTGTTAREFAGALDHSGLAPYPSQPGERL